MTKQNENLEIDHVQNTIDSRAESKAPNEKNILHKNPNLSATFLVIIIWFLIHFQFFFTLPAGIDFSAHLFRSAFFQKYGVNGDWNNLWYAGSPFLEQYPPNTTFFLWITSLFFSLNSSYVVFLVITHLVISLSVYFTAIKLGRNVLSSLFCSLFILTLPNLNYSFMFYSRASTHIGIVLLIITLGLFYNEKRLSAVAFSCFLSLTHFMMFGFLIVIVFVTEIIIFITKLINKIKMKQKQSSENILVTNGKIMTNKVYFYREWKTLLFQEFQLFIKRIVLWIIPFLWVYIFMQEFFSQPILALMISFHSLKDYTDGPGIIYWIFRVLRDFIESYISKYVFMFIALFAISLRSEKINEREIALIISIFLITIIGFLMYYHETNEILPLIFRGMDVLRFILMTQLLIILVSVRGIKSWKEGVFLTIILLLPIAQAYNGVVNYGYQKFDDSHWNDLNPVAEELKNRSGFFYACPKGYQGDHMGYLPILSGKPYFDGWNHHGCRLSWYQNTPPSTQKYRPNSTLINNILNYPEKYGVKWMIAGKEDYYFPNHWIKITTNDNQSKWLWETKRNVSLIDVNPNGTALLEYISPNVINITILSILSSVNLTIRIAHHPNWIIQENSHYRIQRENQIGFMKINNVNDSNIVLVFQSDHVKILFMAFFANIVIIVLTLLFEYDILQNIVKKVRKRQI